ncbi:MAG TPA: pyridine nucleotide-disulfide oxidoreductase [Oceanospirillales bacterium]|nr:pyridine nucleotide-disulfide oxidoreductase [Oleispira sp.]HCM06672.1 pyridine nucleotide-disulfide oxidoreductase [Oceanospirillales bacterium]|tara:strand:- start:9740 stop:11020 length:1281 start_codon:yes stop_codon:yes gene_type:complete
MAHIVVLGAGTGGMAGAYEIREALSKKEHTITLINEREEFQFVPSNPWIAVGWRDESETTIPIKKYVNKKGIEFIAGRVDEIKPDDNQLLLNTGATVDYDYLVIATGPDLAFDQIPGAGPEGFTQSVCTVSHAKECHENVKELMEEPGPVIVGAFQGSSCFGPAYEYAFILEKSLRDKKIRDKVPMTYVTSEPYIGHLGLGGVGDSKSMLESDLRNHSIKWICNASVTKVEDGTMFVDEYNDNKEVIKQHELPFKHSMLIPPFRGVSAVANVPNLCNPKGFVIVDEYQRSPTYNNIYSAGVCIAIPPVEDTPVPTGTPKTGYMIESMMTAITENLAHVLKGEEPTQKGSLSAICLADMGDTGAAFVAIPQIPPRNVTWFKKGKWVHYAKIAFEKYFMYKMKRGTSEPIYEKYTLKALGIERLKEDK